MIETFGIAVCRVTMTRSPLGSVFSTRGASWNGRSGPTAGRSWAAALVAVAQNAITSPPKPDTTDRRLTLND